MARWREGDHPRDRRGRFAEKAGRWASQISERMARRRFYNRAEGRNLTPEVAGRAAEFGDMYRLDGFDGSDNVLVEICRMQGFDGKPVVGTEAEVNEAIADGGVELWRGVSGELPSIWGYGPDKGKPAPFHPERSPMAYHEQWRTGPLYQGSGIYGQGTYTSVKRKAAEAYGATYKDRDGNEIGLADPRSLSRMVLSPEARVIDWREGKPPSEYIHELHDHMDDAQFELSAERAIREEAGFDEDDGYELDQDQVLRLARRERVQAVAVLSDWGRAAAAMGYDAIRVRAGKDDGSGYNVEQYVILNRTAVMVQEADSEDLLPPEVVRVSEVA